MTINHINLVVADLGRSRAFYGGLLGMRVTYETVLTGPWIEEVVGLPGVTAQCVFLMPDGGGCRIELLQYDAPQGLTLPESSAPNTHGLRHFALEVADLDDVYRRLAAAGVDFVSPPITVPFRLVDGIQKRLCYCKDPDGVIVEICTHERV